MDERCHSSTLLPHKRRHDGVTLYDCDICGKKFVHRSTLSVHPKRHTDEKQHQFSARGEALQLSTFRAHQKIIPK